MSSISHGAPQKRRIIPNPGLWLAIIAGIIITLLPLGDTLPVAGQNMIAILVFAIIVWISEAMDYTASAIVISALIIFPALSAMRMFRSFRSVVICSVCLSVICTFVGIIISILAGTPVGSTIVAIDIAVFLIFYVSSLVCGRKN